MVIERNNIVSDNLAKAMVKLVAADSLPALLGNLVTASLVRREFEPTTSSPTDIELKTVEASFTIPDVTKVLTVLDLLSIYGASNSGTGRKNRDRYWVDIQVFSDW
jgi:hypothetical protein